MSSIVNNESITNLKTDFANFLFEKDLLQLILAVYLGTVLQDFFNSFVQGIIMPLLILFVPNSKYTNFEDIQIRFLGKNLAVGEVVVKLINVFLGFVVSYIFVTHIVYKYLK